MSNPEIKGPLTIAGFYAENIKRISVVNITPTGPMVQITGKNGQGKSSVMDAIHMALASAAVVPERPIRKGAKEGIIKLDLGEVKVTRKFDMKEGKEFTTRLVLEAANGTRFTSPQTVLDSLYGALTMNPLDFLEAGEEAQFKTLRAFVKGIDFAAIEGQNKTDHENRTDENRKAKELKAQAAGIIVPDGTWEKIDVTQVVADLEAAEEHNKTLTMRQQRRVDAENRIIQERKAAQERRDEIYRLKNRIAALEEEAAALEESADTYVQRLATAEPLPEEIDTAALRQKITQAQTVNANADKAARKKELLDLAGKHEAASQALTDAMEARSEHVRASIAAAEMPVPGLTLEDGKVYLNGIALPDANRAEQLRLSIAVAMALNPTIRVIRIKDGGNDLDEDSMAIMKGMAEERGYQIWIERIKAEGGPPAIVMEDGHAKE